MIWTSIITHFRLIISTQWGIFLLFFFFKFRGPIASAMSHGLTPTWFLTLVQSSV